MIPPTVLRVVPSLIRGAILPILPRLMPGTEEAW